MDNLNLLKGGRARSGGRLTRNNKLFKTILHAIQEKKGEDIKSLNLKDIPEAVSDFFIICEASNPIQLKAIADSVEMEVKQKCGELPFKVAGREGERWILIDYVNVVVHIMLSEARTFYKLEEMWNDADIKEHNT